MAIDLIEVLTCGVAGFAISWFVIWGIRRRSMRRFGADYLAQFHHTHEAPVSRLGGIGLAAAFLVVSVTACAFFGFFPLANHVNLTLVLGSLAMFTVGLCDDLWPL